VARIEDEHVHQEIQEQAAIAARRASAPAPEWTALTGRSIARGAGDSLCLDELARELLPQRLIAALPAMEASRRALELGPGDLWIGITVSGCTPRVVEGARRARARGALVVAATDDPGSALAAEASAVWCIEASPAAELATSSYRTEGARAYVGYHHDVAQTKSFLAGLLTLMRAGAPELDQRAVAARVAERVSEAVWRPLLERAPQWAGAGQAFLLATGSALPLARFGAYKLYERCFSCCTTRTRRGARSRSCRWSWSSSARARSCCAARTSPSPARRPSRSWSCRPARARSSASSASR
jgi:fructoselysine-6-P-deglycase FrlB-like protein